MKKQEYNDNLLGTIADLEIARITGKNINWIWKRRTTLGIDKCKITKPRYNYNIKAFDNIDNISAYWLGYYFADGNICKSRNRSLITASSVDEEIIVKLSEFYGLNSGELIYQRKVKDTIYYSLQLCNEYLFNKLNSLGCVPNKSFIIDAPIIDPKFYNSFMVGVFDGDGSISLNKSINQWKVSIGTGSPYFIKWLESQVGNLTYGLEKRKNGKKLFYNIVFVGLAAKEFLSRIYKSVPDGLPLSRKKEKFNLIETNCGPKFQNWELEIISLHKENLNLCKEMIESDERNFGWKRSINSLSHKRLLENKKNVL